MKNLLPVLVVCSLFCATAVYADDETALNQAMGALNVRARAAADKKFVFNAISQQTGVPQKTLESQMRTSRLDYAELIAANSLVEGGGKSVDNVLTLKGRGKSWAALSKDLKIDPNSILARVRNADKTLQTTTAQTGNAKQPLPGFTDVRVQRGIGTASNRFGNRP
jgi:lambda repressor-like predicted transcriptional regulator